MESDSQAIAIGLGAGLGGFVGFVIVACLLWHCFCGSWCEKKKVQSTIMLVPVKEHQKTKHELAHQNHVTTISFMTTKHTSPHL